MQFPKDQGQQERTVAQASDTEERDAEEVCALLGQLELLPLLEDELWILDADARCMYVNRPARASLLHQCPLDTLPPEAREEFQRALASVQSTGAVARCEIAWPDGTFSESRLAPLSSQRSRPHVLVTIRDTTAIKRAEAERRETETRLRSALDASGVGSWSWSMLTGALVWDARMCEIWGLPAGPESYAAYLATMHPDDLERVKGQVEQTLTSGHFEEFEHRIVRPSGEVRHLHCRAIAVVDADGTTVGMRGGVFDVTDRKLLEERLRNAHRLQAVGQLTAGIAHNFNNLLGIILPSVELSRGASPSVAAGYLDDIQNAGERAAEMVRQLMQFGRHELGAPKRAVGLEGIVSRLLHVCRTTFDPRIAIECSRLPDRLPIRASAGEIEQVLLNVCINARDALASAQIASPAIRIEVTQGNKGFVRVRISDNGPGMRSEVRARIFEPFFTTKGVGSGTGLGLASAYGIMRDHGGTISCESEPGMGTSFTIELPMAPEPALDEPRSIERTGGGRNTETILLVDDELALRRVLRIILEQAGFRVLEAHDGMAGLQLLDNLGHEVDLVVLDRSMPRVSGDQFLVALRCRNLKLPVIVLTGQGGDEVAGKGVSAVLLKPPASGELVRTIRAVLDEKRVEPDA